MALLLVFVELFLIYCTNKNKGKFIQRDTAHFAGQPNASCKLSIPLTIGANPGSLVLATQNEGGEHT